MVCAVEPLLNIHETAKTLSLSERKVWSLVAGGEIPTVRIGRAVRFDPMDLRTWIDGKKTDQ